MVLKQLAYLVALSREQHFGRAAEACNVSQPTLSAAIRNLEDEVGAPIVERGHRFNGFTPDGLVVLDHAKRILAECDTMRQGLSTLAGGLSGRLRIGVVPTALPMVSQITAPFYHRYPKVRLSVLSMTSNDIIRGLDNFEIDVGLTYLEPTAPSHMRAKSLYEEDFIFLTSDHGPYASYASITWAEAAETPLCLLTPDMQNRQIVDGIFRAMGTEPMPAMETNSIFNLCTHASAGQWSSIVPGPLLYFFGMPRGTKAIPLIQPTVHKAIGLIMSDREPMSLVARSIFDMVTPLDPAAVLQPPKLPLGQ